MKLLMMFIFLIVQFFPHTYEDAVMLATVMYKENGYTGKTEQENRECLILTGVVPVNRALNGGWGGNTLHDVIYAKGQYAESTKKAIGKVTPPDYIIQLAEEILTYGTNVPRYVVFQSTQPKLGTRWKVIDGEYFATDGGHKDEGFSMVAEINRSFGSMFRIFSNFIGSSGIRECLESVICNSWRFSDSAIGRWLDSTNGVGGTDQ